MAPNQPSDPDLSGSLRLTTFAEASLSRVSEDGASHEVLGPGKPLCVLIYLACSPDKSATRDHLIDLLWANLDLDSARHALRQALWYLRRELGDDAIRSRGPELQLSVPVDTDRDRFMEAIARRNLEEAVDLYRGEFLPMFAAPGGADFEKWADAERYRLKTHFIRAGQAVVQMRLERAEFERAKRLAARIRDADPLSQSAWRLLLETLLTANDHARARIEAHAMEQEFSELQRELEPPLRRLLQAARAGFFEPSPNRREEALNPELIGRQREFATILSAWREARFGHGRAIHISGTAGLGKSRLLGEIEARLKAMGARTVLVRAHHGDRELRYSLVSDLAASLAELPGREDLSGGAAKVLVALNPDLTNSYDVTPDESTGRESLRRRALAMHSILAAVAGRQPVAVLIDDLHWVDPASLQVLKSLHSRLAETPTLVLTTARPESLRDRFPHQVEEQLTLEPLSGNDIESLLASLGTLPETAWGDALPDALCAATGGSPLLVIETLRLALSKGWLSLEDGMWECPDPESLYAELAEGRALNRRVENLSGLVFRLLLLLCVAGRPLSADRLARMSKRSLDSIEKELRDLEVDGLAARIGDSWRVAHDEIASAVLEVADHSALVESHQGLGRSLARGTVDDPPDLLRAGHHLAKAQDFNALQSVFISWVAALRDRGDRRPMDRMVSEFLPMEHHDSEAERRIRKLRLGTRLRLVPAAYKRLLGAAAIVAAILLGGAAITADGPPTPDATLLVLRSSADGRVDGVRLPISREGWESRKPLDPSAEGEPVPPLQGLPRISSLVPAPYGQGWAYSAAAPDSGEIEVFLKSSEGQTRRLTYSPGDDGPRSWAPDGSSLLLQTSRWDDSPWHHLAVLDLDGGDVRRLTRGAREEDGIVPDEASGLWSPDGTRIAFVRKFSATQAAFQRRSPDNELCWTTIDGMTERCFSPEREVRDLIGWLDTWQVLVITGDDSGRALLERIDLETGESDIVIERVERAAASPDGQWLASLRPAWSGRAEGWYVGPVERPSLAIPLEMEGRGFASVVWSFADGPGETRYLDELEIQAPDTVTLGVPVKLRARGIDSQGRPTAVPVLSWSLSGSDDATLGSQSGVLIPGRVTDLTIHASAGGWRRDTVSVAVRPASANLLFSEDWESRLTTNWVPFGEPSPTRAKWPEGGHAYWNRSDDSFNSGTYSRRSFTAPHGLGLEASLSTARTGPRAQDLYVSILAWTEPEAVAEWDHETGGPPGSAVCYFRYPAGDGFENLHRARIGPGTIVQLDSIVPTGRPYDLRLQLFEDSSCGVAVNGEPLARVDVADVLDAPLRVVLTGKSVGTKMLVDDLDVWDGVRDGIDWSEIQSW